MAATMIPFPPELAPSSMTSTLLYNTSVFSSALSNIPVTVENPGIRWRFDMGYEDLDLNNQSNSMIVETLTKVRGKSNRVQLHNMARPETTGSLDTSDKVANGSFLLGSSGWTEVLGTGGVVSYKGLRARITKGSAGFVALRQSMTLTAGGVYTFHIAVTEGTFDRVLINIGSTNAASDLATATHIGTGRYELQFVATATTHISIESEGSQAEGEFVSVADVRVSRAALSAGVDQTGTKILIDNLPASTQDLLKTLDFVGINGELKRLVDYVDSNSFGEATLIIEPPMKLLVPDNSLIVFNRPFTKLILDSDSFSEAIAPPTLSSFSISAIEDLS